MFTDKIDPIISDVVVTLSGKYIISKAIGPVIWTLTDRTGQLHTNKLNNVLYFPDSQVNKLSSTALSESMKDD